MIHLTTPASQHRLWCGESSLTAIRVDIVALCTCIACLERLTDYHRLAAGEAAARIIEVLA